MDSMASSLGQAAYGEYQSTNVGVLKKEPSKIAESSKVKSALADFQGLMVNMMMQSMRSTIQKNELFDGGQGEEIFQSMLDQEYSKQASGADVLKLDNEIRRMYKLPINEVFSWEKIELVPEDTNAKIFSDLGHKDPVLSREFKSNESMPARVTKTLNHFSKKTKLEEFVPEERLKELDQNELKAWVAERDAYLEQKRVGQRLGKNLFTLNKNLLEKVYPDLNKESFENQVQKNNGLQAYKKLDEKGLKEQ